MQDHKQILSNPNGLSSTLDRLWGGFDLTSNQPPHIKSSIEELSKSIWESRNEYCYEGEIDPNLVLYSDWLKPICRDFFQSDMINNIDPENFNWESNKKREDYFNAELFIKLIWLCEILLKDGNFKYTMGTHYNPIFNKFVIHPGGTRQHAVLLFPPKKLKVIHFDTGGRKSKMQGQQLTKIDNYIEFCNKNDYQVVFVPDHGTFIPHPLKGTQTIISNKIKHFNIIKTNLYNFNYESNIKIKELEKYDNPNSLNKCKIKYIYPLNDLIINPLDYIRIIILVILQKEYKCKNFEITWKKIF